MTPLQQLDPTPQELMVALEFLGWTQSGQMGNTVASWSSGRDELIIPLDPTRGDFGYLLNRAIRALEQLHGDNAERTLNNVIQSTRNVFDVSRFMCETNNRAGLISWAKGKSLYDAAEQSLLAAARSTRAPRKYHGNASAYLAHNVIQSAFMGQTEISSFVVTMLTPPSKSFLLSKADEAKADQVSIDAATGISGRQVLETLESALTGTKVALKEYRTTSEIEVFDDLANSGVSAELLKALSSISQEVSESGVTLEFSREGHAARRNEFTFSGEDSPILERASRRFMEDPEPRQVTIVGSTTLLERPKFGENGIVRVRVHYGSDIKNVRVRIGPDNYPNIVDAHRDGLSIRVTGQLERDRRYYWMQNVVNISVVATEEEQPSLFDFKHALAIDDEEED